MLLLRHIVVQAITVIVAIPLVIRLLRYTKRPAYLFERPLLTLGERVPFEPKLFLIGSDIFHTGSEQPSPLVGQIVTPQC